MRREELDKYIGELSPELQEKARECKTMKELNALLAENDVELSEDALEAVAGGCAELSSSVYNQGDPVTQHKKALCPYCNQQLYYWDMCYMERDCKYITRMNCKNTRCLSYNSFLWYVRADIKGNACENAGIVKY